MCRLNQIIYADIGKNKKGLNLQRTLQTNVRKMKNLRERERERDTICNKKQRDKDNQKKIKEGGK